MEAQTSAEKNENVEPETASEPAVTAKCVHCGEGMSRDVLPGFNRVFGIVILVMGLLLALFASLLLGLPLVVIGAYMGVANRTAWVCRTCGVVVDRIRA